MLIKNGETQKFDNLLCMYKDKYYKYIVMLIIFLGAVPRLWKFGIVPAGFNQDGAMGAVDALALTQYATDRLGMWLSVHFIVWGFGQMSVLLSYLSIPFITMFGLNRFIARLPVVIVSLLSLWVIYKLCKSTFGQKIAIIVLFFSAINPWHIMQSRWALDCNMLPHFFLFSICFLTLGLQKNKKFLYLSMLFFGITMYTYGIAWYTVPLFLLITCVYLLANNRITLKEVFISIGVYLFIALPIFGVMVINYFDINSITTPFFTIPHFSGTARTADILFFSPEFFNQLRMNFQTAINTAILQKPDLPWNTIPMYGVNYLFTLPFTVVGLLSLLVMLKPKAKENIHIQKKYSTNRYRMQSKSFQDKLSEDKKHLQIIILIWFIISFISGLIINNVNVNRINIIFYPMIILTGIGIYMIIRRIKFLGIATLIIYIIAFAGFNNTYFGEHSKIIEKHSSMVLERQWNM